MVARLHRVTHEPKRAPNAQPFYRATFVVKNCEHHAQVATVSPPHLFTKGRSEALSGISTDAGSCAHLVMSALPPIAAIGTQSRNVRFVRKQTSAVNHSMTFP
jgi:hypothetical protein